MQEIYITLPVGTIIRDRYVIEDLLGKGGFGAVYLVRDLRVRQNIFALKELHDPSKQERDRFTFEGEVLKRLDHPALPRIYRVFNDDNNGRAYILMDYIEGTNLDRLRHLQPEKHFSQPQVFSFMAPIIDAVSYLHHQHPPIIHRDIKPANIIAPKEGNGTVLVDFGIAKEYDPESTTTAVRRCSPGYGAPEQYSSGTNIRTDVYGLGATIYTLLTGVVPTDAFYRMTQLGSKNSDPLEPVNQVLPSLPASTAEAIQRSMALNSDERFPSVEQFWQALTSRHGDREARPAGDGLPLILMPPATVHASTTVANYPAAPKRPRRRTWLLLLPLLAILLVGIGIAAGLLASAVNHPAANSATPTTVLATPRPSPTSQPTVTPASPTTQPTTRPNPAPPTYPNVAGQYNGTIQNTTAGSTANMTLSVRQHGGAINGSFTVTFPLLGSGPFTGSISTNKHIQFTVRSSQVPAPLLFQGTIQSNGSMKGSYCSLDQAGQCNPAAGGAGNWTVSRPSSPSGS